MKTSSKSQLQLAEIKTLAIETFGTEAKAKHWLDGVNPTLGDALISPANLNIAL